jgi:hypothetical protein
VADQTQSGEHTAARLPGTVGSDFNALKAEDMIDESGMGRQCTTMSVSISLSLKFAM